MHVPSLALCILFATTIAAAPIGAQGACGDCNGDGPVNILDALVAAQHGVGLITITPPEFCLCDVVQNGLVDILDALRIAQDGAGIPVPLFCTPGCTPIPPTGYPGEGTGTHYWIDGGAGLDTNPGTMASPWQTVDRIETAALQPGDLVHVVSGSYPILGSLRLIGITGTPSAWIGLQAEGAVQLINSALQNVVNVQGCHYLFLRGFEITHDNAGQPFASWDGVDGIKFQSASSDNVAIDTCRIHDLGNVGVSSQAPEVRDITVVGCEIHDCYTGIYWGYYEDSNKRYAHDCTIQSNYLHDCPPIDLDGTGYGIQIKGGSRGNLIADNVLVRTAGNTRAAIAVYHISTDAGTETARNVLRGNFIRAARGEGIYAAEGALVENNVLHDSGSVAINVTRRDTGSWGVFYGNLTVRNNTVYEVADPAGAGLFVGSGAFTPPLLVSSNLLAVTGGGQLSLRLPGGFAGTSTANHCFGTTSGTAGIVTLADLSSLQSTTYGTPSFLFPTAGGALVSSADPGTAAPEDFNATTRDMTPDTGAYESTGGPNPGGPLSDSFKP